MFYCAPRFHKVEVKGGGEVQHIVVNTRQLLPPFLAGLLPPRLVAAVEAAVPEGLFAEELRLRRGRCASLVVTGENLRLDIVLSGEEMNQLLLLMCAGSLYAHHDTLREGYLVLENGVRVGVGGRAAVLEGKVNAVDEVSVLVIRLPHRTPAVGAEICTLFESFNGTRGILLFSPPGVGKTTVLRGVATLLSGGPHPRRTAVIDTRGELGGFVGGEQHLLDVLSGYPRGRGIGIATRTLSAQVILSDEIGDLAEAQEIVAAHIGGVPLIATAHAFGVRELLARPGMRLLHEARCFGAYVRVSRAAGHFCYRYDITDWEAADAFF